MATDEELRADGWALPTNADYVSGGDDAISRNARRAYTYISALYPLAVPANLDLNNVTYTVRHRIRGTDGVLNTPTPNFYGSFSSTWVSTNLVVHEALDWRTNTPYTRTLNGTTWSAWAAVGKAAPPAEVRHAILEEELARYMPAPELGAAVPVAIIMDHGTNNYASIILPKLKALGLDASVTLALNSDQYNPAAARYAHDNATTWSQIDGWACEIANHGRTHNPQTTEDELRHEIVDGLAELRAKLPNHRILNWVQTGQANNTTWQGFANGATSEAWANSAAGSLIYGHHAASTGAVASGVEALYTMNGTPRQGVWGYWIDTPAGIATAKNMISKAVAQRKGLILRHHPEVLNTTGNSTSTDMLAMLDWLAAEQTAGRIKLVTFAQWSTCRVPVVPPTLDTGWRVLSSWGTDGVVKGTPLPAGATPTTGVAGSVWIRRQGDEITMRLAGLTVNGTAQWDEANVAGGWMTSRYWHNHPISWGDGTMAQAVIGWGFVRISAATKHTGTYGIVLRWHTEKPWPTTIPGTPL